MGPRGPGAAAVPQRGGGVVPGGTHEHGRVGAHLTTVPDAVQGETHQQAAGRVEVRGSSPGGFTVDWVRLGTRGGAGWVGQGGAHGGLSGVTGCGDNLV